MCKNKSEAKLVEFLRKVYSDVTYGARFSWCKNTTTGKVLPFDVGVGSVRVMVELDGAQHFRQSPEATRDRDVFKMCMARMNGYSVVRLLQEDVWRDTFDWRTRLRDAINGCGEGGVYFVCANDEYADMEAEFK